MRIISKYRDYYDIGLSHGMDNDLVFIREQSHITGDDVPDLKRFKAINNGFCNRMHYFTRRVPRKGLDIISLSPVSVYFCGKIYFGIRGHVDGKNDNYYWTFDSLVEHLKEKYDYDITKKKNNFWFSLYNTDMLPLDQLMTPMDVTEWSIENRVSIAVRNVHFYNQTHPDLMQNAILKDVDFVKVFDPYTAFQELSMWIGNLPKDGPEMVEIADKDRIAKHGFDEWSFRKKGNGRCM